MHRTHQHLVRSRLANGLRVLLAPDRTVPVVAVAVHYDVGMRSEPEGRTGFAHLFEHLMFQGSELLPKLDHAHYVQASGGVFNGSTHLDYTQYHNVLPSNALERALFLEADRMRAPNLNAENLRVQIDVVKEEIRANVTNKPYGCFPWVTLPGVLFDTFANSHDGYGSFDDLDSATVEDARQFFDRYYAPANALLTLCGDFDADEALAMVERHFGPIPFRPRPPRPDFAEPEITGERRTVKYDPHAPLPAVAAGWRVPDPIGRWDEYLPYLLLADVMSDDGPACRLHRRLVRQDGLATSHRCYLGMLGDPLDTGHPTALVCSARQTPGTSSQQVLDAIAEEFALVARHGPGERELNRIATRLTTRLLVETDAVLARTQALASLELRHGRAELLGELPALLTAITPEQVARAAARITPDRRAVVELLPASYQEEAA